MLPLLQSLASCADVRPKLHARFNMPHWFKAQGVSLPVQITPRSQRFQPGMRFQPGTRIWTTNSCGQANLNAN